MLPQKAAVEQSCNVCLFVCLFTVWYAALPELHPALSEAEEFSNGEPQTLVCYMSCMFSTAECLNHREVTQ